MEHPARYLLACLSLCASAAFGGNAQEDRGGCTPIAAAPSFEPFSDTLGGVPFTWWHAEDVCYADGIGWIESVHDNQAPFYARVQRFDFWLPSLQSAAPRPLVVYAHPQLSTEDIGRDRDGALSSTLLHVLAPAMQAGYALATLEFRHPGASVVDDGGSRPPVPNTDIAQAVQFLRHHAQQLGIDADNVFLAGQSRGSLAILTGLMPNLRQWDAVGFRSQSSAVNAVFAYQAQTDYRSDEVAQKFVLPEDRARLLAEAPHMAADPGSAIARARLAQRLVPLRLAYDEEPADRSAITLQCYESTRTEEQECAGRPVFDIHDANFGVALSLAYASRGRPLTACYGVRGPSRGWAGLIPFFEAHREPPTGTAEPACPVPAGRGAAVR